MDPVTSILLQALPVLAGAAGSEVAKRAVAELWDSVKKAAQRHFGAEHTAPRLLDELRATHGADPAQQMVASKLAAFQLGADPEILALAQRLSAALAKVKIDSKFTIQATKIGNVIDNNTGPIFFDMRD